MAVKIIEDSSNSFEKVFYCGKSVGYPEEYEKHVSVEYDEDRNRILIICDSYLTIYDVYVNYNGSVGIYLGDGGGGIRTNNIRKDNFTKFLDTTMYKNINFKSRNGYYYIDDDKVWKEIRDYILYLFNNKLDFNDSGNALLRKCIDIAGMYGFSDSPGSEKRIKNNGHYQFITMYDGKNSVCSLSRSLNIKIYRYGKNYYEDMINSFIKLGFEVSQYV